LTALHLKPLLTPAMLICSAILMAMKSLTRFKQGIGRLIRSTTDSGQIAILDSRIATKRYGRVFLNALPEGVEIIDVVPGDCDSDFDPD
jgi:Rad3-related DNA helicase